MSSKKDKIDLLTAFVHRDKFSDQAWADRGLNQSNLEISSKLTHLFDDCVDALIGGVNNNASGKQLKAVLKAQLSKFNQKDFDTEEKEFICDLFYELAQILNIDFADNLSRWLYGSTMNALLKIQAVLNPSKVVETRRQDCQKCGAVLETFIMRKKQGIPDHSWNIVRCNKCKDFSLISIGPNVKEVRFGNYELIEQLPKESFTEEQAGVRLEQIRLYRK